MSQPVYLAIATTLRAEILGNRWPQGTALPTLVDLEKRFGVSRITVRGAVDQLAGEGLVYTGYIDGRRGTIVRSRGRVEHFPTDSLRPDRPPRPHDSFEESAERAGKKPGKRFAMRIVEAPKFASQRLGIESASLVVERATTQTLDGEPWSREVSYFPRDIAEASGIDVPHDLPEGTLRRLRDHGYAEVSWVDEVTDEPAGPEDAATLAVPTGSTLLIQLRTGATKTRVTRVTRGIRMGGRNRLSWELGDDTGISVIRAALIGDTQ